jgi:6-phosphogluconolactonase
MTSLDAEAGGAPASSGHGRPDEPAIVIRETSADVAEETAGRVAAALEAAVEARGVADFVTTGGSTQLGIYRALVASHRDSVDWSRVRFWWGDDRFVPRDHPLSNVQAADAILFTAWGEEREEAPGLPVPAASVHPFRCGEAIAHARGAAWCAAAYAEELRDAGIRKVRGFPVFDVVVVGVGVDGHLLSVFPGSPALEAADWAIAIPAPTHIEPHVERVTLNPAILGVAGTLIAVAGGAAKAAILGQVFGTDRDVRRWPAQLARRTGATWILDRDAARGVHTDGTGG